MKGTPRAEGRLQPIATGVLLALAVISLLGACGTKNEGSANTEASGTAGTSPQGTTPKGTTPRGSGGTTAPGGREEGNILSKVASFGADAALESRFAGAATEAKSGFNPLVFFGRAGDQALVYICDGTKSGWYTGSVSATGAGTLHATDGTSTVDLTGEGDELAAKFAEGAFDKVSTKLTKTDNSTTLVRIDRSLTDGEKLIGGIIITPDAVRGVVNVTLPTTPPSVSTSSTRPPSTTTAGVAPLTPTRLVSQTPTGVLSFTGPSTPSLTADKCDANVIKAAAATIESLANTIKAASDQLRVLREQKGQLQARRTGATDAERAALDTQIANIDRQIANIQKMIETTQAQIDDISKQVSSCGGTPGK